MCFLNWRGIYNVIMFSFAWTANLYLNSGKVVCLLDCNFRFCEFPLMKNDCHAFASLIWLGIILSTNLPRYNLPVEFAVKWATFRGLRRRQKHWISISLCLFRIFLQQKLFIPKNGWKSAFSKSLDRLRYFLNYRKSVLYRFRSVKWQWRSSLTIILWFYIGRWIYATLVSGFLLLLLGLNRAKTDWFRFVLLTHSFVFDPTDAFIPYWWLCRWVSILGKSVRAQTRWWPRVYRAVMWVGRSLQNDKIFFLSLKGNKNCFCVGESGCLRILFHVTI